MSIRVRRARAADAREAAAVLRASISALCVADHGNDPEVLRQWLASKTPDDVRSWIEGSGRFVVAEERGRIVGVVAAVSGGAALATILLAGGWSRFFPRFLELAASSKGNVQLGNLLLRRPVFPHPRISRDSFLHSVSAQGLRRLYAGPDLRIVISHPPRLLGAGPGSLVAAAVSGIEKHLTERLRVRWLERLGFRTTTVRARDCRTPEELVHAIFQSSAAPPVFPVTRRNGRPALDGGLVENVPLSAVAECRRPLVLLSRHVRDLPRGGRELYACPSKPVPIRTWDFSSPDKVVETFELGRSDGTRFLRGYRVAPAS